VGGKKDAYTSSLMRGNYLRQTFCAAQCAGQTIFSLVPRATSGLVTEGMAWAVHNANAGMTSSVYKST